MPLMVDVMERRSRTHRPGALRVQLRSVIPGRQRWDIGIVLGRPRVAELLEAGLRESPGVGMVRANPVTGRLLVQHDVVLSGQDVDQLVRDACPGRPGGH